MPCAQLDRETARFAIAQPIEECKAQFADMPKVVQHLDAIQADILENVALFINPQAAATRASLLRCASAACSIATRSTCWSPRRTARPARR